MRLTLRTMLAWLDDILEPNDATDVGKKIEESEFASSLVGRIRDVNRRLRLGAPKLEGKGVVDDPNNVAEYLDNTLPPDKVSEFEKKCLDSDVHLAEVASSHQILTLVLGEPAQVDAESRRRMYRIPAEAEERRKSAAAAAAAPAAATAATTATQAEAAATTTAETAEAKPKRERPEVPEYLRQPSPEERAWWKPIAAVVVGLALLALLAVAFWPGPGAEVAENPEQDPAVKTPDTAGDEDGIDAQEEDATKVGATTAPTQEPEADLRGTSGPSAEPGSGEVPEVPETPSTPPVTASPVDEPPVTPDTPVASPRAATAPPAETPPGGEPAVAETPAATPPTAEPPLEEPVVKPESADSLGRVVSNKQVLLKALEGGETWQRLPSLEPVAAGDRLLSLPTFRSVISLSSGVTLHLLGGTEVTLLGLDERGVPGLRLHYGRVVMMTVGRAGARVRVEAASRQGMVTFGDAAAVVGLELDPAVPTGADPTASAAIHDLVLYADKGEILWDERAAGDETGEPRVLVAPATLTLTGDPANDELEMAETAAWIASSEPSPLDKRASAEVEQALTSDRPVALVLRELSDHRQVEVAALAVRSLGYLGVFDMLVNALSNEVQKNFWDDQIVALRSAVARSPEAAAAVHNAFERLRRDDAPALYRMLWGYTAEQLKGDEALRLVTFLSHEDLDFRVLSFWNLRDITGMNLGYHPQYNALQRQRSVRRWKEKYEAGEIAPNGSASATPPNTDPALGPVDALGPAPLD